MSVSSLNIALDESTLIAEVQARPALWDPSDESYEKRLIKREVWEDLCVSVFPDLPEFPEFKQNEIVQQIRHRWHQLRSSYRQFLTKGTNCPFAVRLSFLDKCFPNLICFRGEKSTPFNSMLAQNDNCGIPEVPSRVKKRLCHHKKIVSLESENPAPTQNIISPTTATTRLYNPMLSLSKIDRKMGRSVAGSRSPPRSPDESYSPQQQVLLNKTPSRNQKYPSSRNAPPPPTSAESEDEFEDDVYGDRSKRCKHRYEVQMASAAQKTGHPRGQPTSTLGTISLQDENTFKRRKEMAPALDCYRENEGGRNRRNTFRFVSSTPYAGAEIVSHRVHRTPPSTLRVHESFYDGRNSLGVVSQPIDYEDEELSFFRSLLTWTKRFDEDQKLEFRSEIMKLVSRIRDSEMSDNYYVISQTSPLR